MSDVQAKPKGSFSVWTVVRMGSYALGILSLASLAMTTLNLGPAAALRDVFGYYEWLLENTIGLLEEPINYLVGLLPLHLPKINPMWRHMWVIMGLSMAPMIRFFLTAEGLDPLRSRVAAGIFFVGWTAFALYCGLSVPENFNPSDHAATLGLGVLMVAASMMLGLLTRQWAPPRGGPLVFAVSRDGLTILVGATILILLNAGLDKLGR